MVAFGPANRYDLRVLITFEGPEGAGKTTIIRMVADRLTSRGHEVVVTREPGHGEFGAKIREILLSGQAIEPMTELFLFLADRSQHVATCIRPALEAGAVILCDRYADSTVVYQGYGRGLDLDWLRDLNSVATGGLVPDMTLLLDLDPAVGLRRIQNPDRMDRESIDFHQRVRQGFLSEARRQPERWVVLSSDRPAGLVIGDAMQAIFTRLPEPASGG